MATENVSGCRWCDQPMDGRSCTGDTVTIVRTDVGEPGEYPRVQFAPYGGNGQRCRGCATPAGGLHHPGCDNERCPNPACVMPDGRRCQAISCDCVWKGDPLDVHPLVVAVAIELDMTDREQVELIAKVAAEVYRYMGRDIGPGAAMLTILDCERIADKIEESVTDEPAAT